MIEIKVSVTDGTGFERFGAAFIERVTPRVETGMLRVEQAAKLESPRYLGGFANSIEAVAMPVGEAAIRGEVFTSSPYGGVIEGVDSAGNEVEWGRRPGAKFPDLGPLRLWVVFKLGDEIRERVGKAVMAVRALKQKVSASQRGTFEESQIDEATFNVGRAIKARGIRPKRPIGNAFQANLDQILADIEEGIDEALQAI